jgi:hypothetical protein
MNKTFASLMLAVAVMGLSACDNAPRPPTDSELRATALSNSAANAKLQDLLEQQRSTAKDNAASNAAGYFAANPRFDSTFKIVPHTDDYISPACPQGSGWARASVMKVEGKEVQKATIWCSTSSASVGCMIDTDFGKSPYAAQAGKCDANLPHPLKPFGGK